MNSLQKSKAPLTSVPVKKNPDVVVTHADQTARFTARNQRASEWLHRRCGLAAENISSGTEILVHPRKCQRVITDLKTAGFLVADEREKP